MDSGGKKKMIHFKLIYKKAGVFIAYKTVQANSDQILTARKL